MTSNHNQHQAPAFDPEPAASLLSAHKDFRVLRRVADPATLVQPVIAEAGPDRIGIAIDVETTGLDCARDTIIELSLRRFRFDQQGRITKVDRAYSWLQDPGHPLDPAITRITGLTDTDLAGQQIDTALATELLNSASFVVAHNAGFDRGFVEAALPDAAGLPWACSMADLDWDAEGKQGRSLLSLLMQCGWFHDGHRAEVDVDALMTLLAEQCADGRTAMSKIIEKAERPTVRLTVTPAFEKKDMFKARGYRWNPVPKTWSIEVDAADEDAECRWMRHTGGYFGTPRVFHITARERHL